MNCPQCNEDLPDDSTFCRKCGERVATHSGDDSGHTTGDIAPTTGTEQFNQHMTPRNDPDDDPDDALWAGGFSGKAMIGSWMIAGVITVVAVIASVLMPPAMLFLLIGASLVWIGLGVALAYRKMNVSYELTSQRFVHRSGILKRVTDRIEVIDMDDVTFEQGIIERAMNVGTIRITSSDRSHPELMLCGIEDVARVSGMIDRARRKERVRRGVHMEVV